TQVFAVEDRDEPGLRIRGEFLHANVAEINDCRRTVLLQHDVTLREGPIPVDVLHRLLPSDGNLDAVAAHEDLDWHPSIKLEWQSGVPDKGSPEIAVDDEPPETIFVEFGVVGREERRGICRE